MAGRIRTLKPEWLENESLGGCSDAARVLSAGLVLLADDFGNGRGAPGFLVGQVWPYHRDAVEARETLERASRELLAIGYVRFYRSGGQTYFHLPGWTRHQKVDKPSRTRAMPTPQEDDFIQPELGLAPSSRDSRETLGLDPIRSDQDPTRPAAAAHAGTRDPSVPEPAPRPHLGEACDRLWAEYLRLSEVHGLPAKKRVPGSEMPILRLLREDRWTVEQVEHALADVAARAAAHDSEREWWDGKRTWSAEVLDRAMALVAGAAPGRGEIVPLRPLSVRVGRAEPRADADYEAEKGREF